MVMLFSRNRPSLDDESSDGSVPRLPTPTRSPRPRCSSAPPVPAAATASRPATVKEPAVRPSCTLSRMPSPSALPLPAAALLPNASPGGHPRCPFLPAPFQVRGALVIRLGRASGPRLPCGWGGQPSGMGSARGVGRGWAGFSLYRQNRPTIVISMNLVTPAVPCLRQVVHALADPASRDRP